LKKGISKRERRRRTELSLEAGAIRKKKNGKWLHRRLKARFRVPRRFVNPDGNGIKNTERGGC